MTCRCRFGSDRTTSGPSDPVRHIQLAGLPSIWQFTHSHADHALPGWPSRDSGSESCGGAGCCRSGQLSGYWSGSCGLQRSMTAICSASAGRKWASSWTSVMQELFLITSPHPPSGGSRWMPSCGRCSSRCCRPCSGSAPSLRHHQSRFHSTSWCCG